MDGYSLSRKLREVLGEGLTSDFISQAVSYDYIYAAVVELVRRTELLKSSQSITTVASQRNYTLNPDFLYLYNKSQFGEYWLRLNNGTSFYDLYFKEYSTIQFDNNTVKTAYPDSFAIREADQLANVTGSASLDGVVNTDTTYGESTLVDTNDQFGDVYAGDRVFNVTDGSNGHILRVNSVSTVTTGILGGTDNGWHSGDSYVITPQQRYELYLDPPPSTAGYTITVPYVKRPDPVYSYYRRYPLPVPFEDAIVNYAAFLYKYRDREPNYGDGFYKHFDMMCRQANAVSRNSELKKGYKVNMKKLYAQPYKSSR